MTSPVPPLPPSSREFVQHRLTRAEGEAAEAGRRAGRVSAGRLAYVVAVAALFTWAGLWSWPFVLAAAVLFVPLAYAHRRLERHAQHARGLVAACRASLARIDRDWEAMPAARMPELSPRPRNTAAAHDLDVLGDVSLFRLLDVGLTTGGACTVRWLLEDPADLATIQARQASVAALGQRGEHLLESARLSRFGPDRRPAATARQLDRFREWCTQPARPFARSLVWGARLLTVVFVAALSVAVAVPAVREAAVLVIALVVPLQLLVAALARRQLNAGLGGTAELLARLGDIVRVMRAIVDEPAVPGRFGEIQRELAQGHAIAGFSRLARLLDWNAVRHSPLMHYAVNGAVAFDAHLADRVDAWHAEHAAALPRWIDLVAEAQAITALATLLWENPGWTMPVVHEHDGPMVRAGGCGHPLIAPSVRVANPVQLEQGGDTLVITGSNMSGKTTYLRAIGLNALLALAGGPVCATSMTIRRCRVRSSVRVEDDLSRGSSLFFAEVSRIRDVVRDAEEAGAPPVLFLLDEILHGTNAGDRRQATHLVLRRLTAAGGAGLITTHDPGVGESRPELPLAGAVRHAHFTDTVRSEGEGVRMTFDYTLRDGPATTANALRILELLGLGGTDRA